jgi:hypothetical protein
MEKSTGASSGRKRPPPEPEETTSDASFKNQAPETESPDHNVLTPHCLRLLKLIQEGTTQHAQMAANHLTALTAQSSPLVLWDILGSLQFFLTSPDWRTRQNASLAMQGVAQHLPPLDQKHFLQDTHKQQLKQQKQQQLWLTMHDLKSGKLSVILEKGRTLLASSGTQYDQAEEEELQRLDGSMQGREDFCEQRIQLQREILAQRLGLSGVLKAVTGGHDSLSNITGEDLLPRVKRQKHMERIQKDLDGGSDENSIRALLVMQMEQEGGLMAISHRNPQEILATELIYRMFDPSWHVRHGALLGILAIMRAWKAYQSKESFGVWPHDILARCICALALDRFGDYSGVSVADTSAGVVSPIREMAGQVFSVVFLMAPETIQNDAISTLVELSRNTEWEVRQGALLALKYTVVVMKSVVKNESDEYHQESLLVARQVAIQCLEDRSDDVQSAAAQVLMALIAEGQQVLEREFIVRKAINPLWSSLEAVRFVSSCTVDLVRLFSTLLSRDCVLVLKSLDIESSVWGVLGRILNKLVNLIDCEYSSVKRAVLMAMGCIAGPIADSCSGGEAFGDAESRRELIRCFCRVIECVYELFFQLSLGEGGDESSESDDVLSVCYDTWSKVTKASKAILHGAPEEWVNLQASLLFRFFQIRPEPHIDKITAIPSSLRSSQSASYGWYLDLRIAQAEAVARFLIENECDDAMRKVRVIYDVLDLCLSSFLGSPLTPQCEAACFLYQSLSIRLVNKKKRTSPLLASLMECRPVLQSILEDTPLCIVVEATDCLSSHPNLNKICRESFVYGVRMVKDRGTSGKLAAKAVTELWAKAFESQGIDMSMLDNTKGVASPVSMRINVAVAGAAIAGGSESLPPKLTPLVRALMTSVKNEKDRPCQALTCSYMSTVLQALAGQSEEKTEKSSGFSRTYLKILNSLCDLICSGHEPGCITSSGVVEALVRSLPSGQTLEDLDPVWSRLKAVSAGKSASLDKRTLGEALSLLNIVCRALRPDQEATTHIISSFLDSLVLLACHEQFASLQKQASDIIEKICKVEASLTMRNALPTIIIFLRDRKNDGSRLRACCLLQSMTDAIGMEICSFVRALLPLSMSLMTDPMQECSKIATNLFASLVRVAPLVRKSISVIFPGVEENSHADSVLDHLIHGKPLPPCKMPVVLMETLKKAEVSLRPYQMEGISWLRFLQTVNLNGALCDSMGLGKTLQALIAVALSHCDAESETAKSPISLVVCPSTVVGHWMREIERFFPGRVFQALALSGKASQREALWNERLASSNIVVTNYSVLRSDIDTLATKVWRYCILDEGHLLKNPKTGTCVSLVRVILRSHRLICILFAFTLATARASRRIRANHKLILTGTPVQNKVNEVWATFDFLMPNYLGSSTTFGKEFARPISKSQVPGASADEIASGMDKLKILHQQVLPFILRREKEQVLKELPPKIITVIPCDMSDVQRQLYSDFCAGPQVQRSLDALQRAVQNVQGSKTEDTGLSLGSDTLKTLLFLRLLCTHPTLVNTEEAGMTVGTTDTFHNIECSGKLMALKEILRNAGIQTNDMMAADNDASLIYCEADNDGYGGDELVDILTPTDETGSSLQAQSPVNAASKCLIFAQFTHSLDVVEELLLKRHMPSVRYLRLDGRVPAEKRSDVVDAFNNDDSVEIMLLTTRIGGLGLNLTGKGRRPQKACRIYSLINPSTLVFSTGTFSG